MRRKSRNEAIFLAAGLLLALSLACNLSTPTGPATFTPEVRTVIITATGSEPTEGATEEAAKPTATSSSPGDEGGEPTISVDGDIFASVSVKDAHESYKGKISFPGNDNSNEIYVKPVGFDNTVTSGSLVFTLTCSGEGKVKVNYKGGAIKSGSPGCGGTWTVSVITGSPDSHITIRLDDSGEVSWTLSVTGSE
jgi:hypothetical protein